MVTNFDYLKKEPKFSRFVDVAYLQEKLILIDRRQVFLIAGGQGVCS